MSLKERTDRLADAIASLTFDPSGVTKLQCIELLGSPVEQYRRGQGLRISRIVLIHWQDRRAFMKELFADPEVVQVEFRPWDRDDPHSKIPDHPQTKLATATVDYEVKCEDIPS